MSPSHVCGNLGKTAGCINDARPLSAYDPRSLGRRHGVGAHNVLLISSSATRAPGYTAKVPLFGDILALYEFDVELREIMLDALLKVKAKLVKCVNGYLSSDESVADERLLEAMGFPAEWKKITRYKL